MAFGFFKKNETADTIFIGGKIFTQNQDYPWVEAVACKDGLVMAVGDYEDLADFEGKKTEIVDLNGRIMLPGYIDTCGHPVMDGFRDSCLYLENADLEQTLAQLSDYAAKEKAAPIIFAFGYNESILDDLSSEQKFQLLDGIDSVRPILLLGKSGFHCWLNTFALEAVKAAAEEDEIEIITLGYLLGILEPIGLYEIPKRLPIDMLDYCQRGFTSVFDCGAPEFFASLYQNVLIQMFQENIIKQRFFGSLLITSDVPSAPILRRLAQYKTNCVELNEHVNFNTLKLIVDRTHEANIISDDTLRELCLEACDKGFDLHIDAIGEDAVSAAIEAIGAARSAGYKKSSVTLAHANNLEIEDLADTCFRLDIIECAKTAAVTDREWCCIENATSVEAAINKLTIDAALQLGISSSYGSIEKGKHADFVIFDKNPFDAQDLLEFKKLRSVMTVIDGVVVYDSSDENAMDWYSALSLESQE